MAAQQDVDIDAMDWGPGAIEIGTQEAEDAMTALVSAAVEVGGAPAGPSTETKVEQLWRCGTLRSTSPSAMPLLKLAVKHADERYVLRELHCASKVVCCAAHTQKKRSVLRCELSTSIAYEMFDSVRSYWYW